MKKQITLLVLLFAVQVFAQAPQKMSYQSVLRNTSNALITNTTVGMKISILQGSSTGAAVYVETQNPTTNANGLVSLEIGGGTPVIGTFVEIDWANGPFYIKTETAPNGGTNYTITGTTQLLSVPYALYAENSKQQGKTTIILANDITDAQAATQIAKELGPNTENIIIQNTTQLTTVEFSAALSLISISISNNAALTNVNFNSLAKLYGGLDVVNNSNLSLLSMNNLTECKGFAVGGNTNLTSILFTNLNKIYLGCSIDNNNNLQTISMNNLSYFGDLDISYNPNLSSLSLNNLSNCGGLNIHENPNLSSLSLNNLSNCGGLNIHENPNLSSLSFNNLSNSGHLNIQNNLNLSSLALNNLISCGGFVISDNTNLSSLSLNSLTSCVGGIDISNNSAMTSIMLNNLTNFPLFNDPQNEGISISSNSNLTSVSIPNLINFSGGLKILNNSNLVGVTLTNLFSIQFIQIQNNSNLSSLSFPFLNNIGNGAYLMANSLTFVSFPNLSTCNTFGLGLNLQYNKLNSTIINSILHKFLTVLPNSGKNIGLSLQTPTAPPTGQGVIDKTTLINAGNNVSTD